MSLDVSGSASTRVPSRRDVSRRVLGRDVVGCVFDEDLCEALIVIRKRSL